MTTKPKPKPMPVYTTHDGQRRLMVACANKREACELLGCSEPDLTMYGMALHAAPNWQAALEMARGKPGRVWRQLIAESGESGNWQLVGRGGRVEGSTGAASVAPTSRSKPDDKFKGLPGHDLARFLDAELTKREWSANDLFKALQAQGFSKKNDDTVYKWVKGQSTPRLNDLATLAATLGYRDWFALIAAIGRFTAR